MKNKKLKTALIIAIAIAVVILLVVFGIKVKRHFDDIAYYGEKANSTPVMLVAHRGYSAVAPENTLASFTEAGKCGKFYGAECDVKLTKDNVWVIMHDDSVERTTNGTANVSDLTYKEISELKIDFGNGLKDYPDEKVPTFEEYLDICQQYNLRPFIEIKMDADKEQVQSLYDIICKHNFQNNCTIISFHYNPLILLYSIDPNMDIYALASKIDDGVISLCKTTGFGIDFDQSKKQNSIKKLNSLSDQGLKLAAWTVSTQSDYQRLTDNGIKIITCNSPEFSN